MTNINFNKGKTMCLRKLFKSKPYGRKHLLNIVDYIAGMAEKAGRTGIISLEEYWFDSKLPPDCGKLEKFLFLQLLKMLQSCVNESDVSYFAENYIASLEEKDAGEQTLLALKIGAEGFIAVYRSESKAEIESRLKKMMRHSPKSITLSGGAANLLGKLPKPCAVSDKRHLFAVADFLAYMCIKSCRAEKRMLANGHETDVLALKIPLLNAFLNGGKLCLPKNENPLEAAEETLFSQLIGMIVRGESDKTITAFAKRQISALAAQGQLTLPLIVGAETIVGMAKLELPFYQPYECMACRLAGIMGHPFCEEYLNGYEKPDSVGFYDSYRERILSSFAEMEQHRQKQIKQTLEPHEVI